MNKEQKVNYIKYWLQIFGDRNNETFYTEVTIGVITWNISLQYNFDDDGIELKPYDWCTYSFKHLRNNKISDRTEEELNMIIFKLKNKL